MKNYSVPVGKWCPLSDIMGQDYDHTKAYKIYVNEIGLGIVRYFHDSTTPAVTDRGMELKSFSSIDVEADTGDNVYFMGSAQKVDLCIY